LRTVDWPNWEPRAPLKIWPNIVTGFNPKMIMRIEPATSPSKRATKEGRMDLSVPLRILLLSLKTP
jgi:hypothetical protein